MRNTGLDELQAGNQNRWEKYQQPQICRQYHSNVRKQRGTRDQIANIFWITEKARKFQKNIYFCFIDYAKAFDYVDHDKVWNSLKEMGIPDT